MSRRPAATVTQLKVTCPTCGHVRVDACDVRIVVGAPPKGSYYVFGCPDCARRVRRAVTLDVVEELIARGVPAVRSMLGTADEPGATPRQLHRVAPGAASGPAEPTR